MGISECLYLNNSHYRLEKVSNLPKSIDIEFEIGQGFPFEIMDEIDGFWISYLMPQRERKKIKKFNLKLLVKRIKNVMKDLKIEVPHFALEIISNGRRAAACSVDKQKETIHLRLPVRFRNERILVPTRGIHEDYIFHHELMHAKDILENRFPSSGIINVEENPKGFLNTLAWNFSIEGRLEKHEKPHYSKEKSIELTYQEFVEMCMWLSKGEELKRRFTSEFFATLCNYIWGKELTSREVDEIIQKLS